MDSLQDWLDFRQYETYIGPDLICCGCHGPAEGEVTIEGTGEHVCLRCHNEWLQEENS